MAKSIYSEIKSDTGVESHRHNPVPASFCSMLSINKFLHPQIFNRPFSFATSNLNYDTGGCPTPKYTKWYTDTVCTLGGSPARHQLCP